MRGSHAVLLTIFATLSLMTVPHLLSSQTPAHPKVILKGFEGRELTPESKAPYSPKKTCGACHDYDQITKGYHFQQGRTDGTGKIRISDAYDQKYPWNLSSGMYGKHGLASMDSSQLARKINPNPSEIDKSSFFFVQNCGICHPGGGWGEYDRKGNLYYDEESKKFGYEISGDDPRFDGDYTPFSMGNEKYESPWNLSGVSEADCLICHLKGYQWKERGATLRGKFFKHGPAVGAGWATMNLSQDGSGEMKADAVEVDYMKKEVADFENLDLQIVRRPPDENCRFCHTASDGRKRGSQWSPETDIHQAKGLDCLSCHPGNKEHNFAKGDSLQGTVRDDLDHTMNSCEDCHYRRKDKRAPRYRHPFSPRHMKRIACQTCHIPFQTGSEDLVYDHSTGETKIFETQKFLSDDPLNPRKPTPVPPSVWYPAFRDVKGKIVPVKPLSVIYWGDLDEKNNVVKPIFLWKIRDLKKPPLGDEDGDGTPEINTPEEMKAFLRALKGKDRFGNPVAQHPVLMKGGFLYQLDRRGEVEKIKHEQAPHRNGAGQAEPVDFSLSHNIVSGPNVIGARGCQDCHSRKSSFFLRKVLIDPYDEKGNPVYMEAWERMGIDKEKLDRLLVQQ